MVRESGTYCVKIGKTTDMRRRLSDLQTGNPRKLLFVGWLSRNPLDEQSIMARFSRYSANGGNEWFDFDRELFESVILTLVQ